MDSYNKPPLGVMPKWRWLELRGCSLAVAIHRYMNMGNITEERVRYKSVMDWNNELKEVIEELRNTERT